ncbi:MAG: putative ATP-binding protein involved in virulence [Phenylobacterium sp.]|jgi:predicted ATP-binding protein involved in virulence
MSEPSKNSPVWDEEKAEMLNTTAQPNTGPYRAAEAKAIKTQADTYSKEFDAAEARAMKRFRAMKASASQGDIYGLYQLAQYFGQGGFVEIDRPKSDSYSDQIMALLSNQRLQITSLTLTNFRVFDQLNIDFCHQPQHQSALTVIVGSNGAGKTTLLNALMNSLSWFIAKIKSPNSKGQVIEALDINNHHHVESASIITELSIKEDLHYNIELTKSAQTSQTNKKNKFTSIGELANIYKLLNAKNSNFNFPIVAYYGIERAVEISAKDIISANEILGQPLWNKFDGYADALSNTTNFKQFFQWFKQCEDIANAANKPSQTLQSEIKALQAELNSDFVTTMERQGQLQDEAKVFLADFKQKKQQEIEHLTTILNSKKRQPDRTLEYVTKAIERFMPGFANLRVQRTPNLDMLIDKNELTLSVLQLSQGEKSLIALVGDIARRLILLNPSLEDPLKGNGVVLIDEIDLHLHPKWQQTVLTNLVETFPSIQFITTTHSPQVITSIHSDCIRVIHDGVIHSAPGGLQGAEASRALNRLFEVESRPPQDKYAIDLKTYLDLVYNDKWNCEQAQQLRVTLQHHFKGEEPELTAADLYVENRQWELDIEKD